MQDDDGDDVDDGNSGDGEDVMLCRTCRHRTGSGGEVLAPLVVRVGAFVSGIISCGAVPSGRGTAGSLSQHC